MANHGADDAALGLHLEKFAVTREDGAHEPGERHEGCRYFPLDLDHDPHAIPAIAAYAGSCRLAQPKLAAELMALVDAADKR